MVVDEELEGTIEEIAEGGCRMESSVLVRLCPPT
jgi:hypothetical protein